jgi:excisionase family DNA binding protein
LLISDERWNGFDTLSVKEAARALRCSPQTVYRACHEGRIEWFRLREHGAIRIPFFALEGLIRPHLMDTLETAKNATAEEVEA